MKRWSTDDLQIHRCDRVRRAAATAEGSAGAAPGGADRRGARGAGRNVRGRLPRHRLACRARPAGKRLGTEPTDGVLPGPWPVARGSGLRRGLIGSRESGKKDCPRTTRKARTDWRGEAVREVRVVRGQT